MIAKGFAAVLGVVLLLIGVVGFFSGSHDHEMVGFGVNLAHHLVHLVSGVVALAAAAMGERMARNFCAIFGAVYGAVAVAGFLGWKLVIDLLNLNRADDYLHAGIAAGCFVAAALSAQRSGVTPPAVPPASTTTRTPSPPRSAT